jgi:phosphatidylserine/phosphatidylglycerophosphate/cardiolipin synthase-like enzyme
MRPLFPILFASIAALAFACSASDVGGSADETTLACGDYVAPDAYASCTSACSGDACQHNGCYGGYACRTSTNKCVAKPSSCKNIGNDPILTSYFETPSTFGLQPVIDAVNGAQSSIRMVMFHLTVQDVVDALAAAGKRGVDVEIIIDQGNWSSHTPQALKTELAAAGVVVHPSSAGFRITHEKSFVVDETTAYIMSLNLTSPFVTTRDYAVVTHDAGIVKEFLSVFAADVNNAENGTATTPTVSDAHLAWSPVNSESRLVAFVAAAKKTLVVSSENLGDAPIQAALIAAAKRGVDVRVLAPLCDQNTDPTYDLPFLATLAQGGVEARAMPAPSTATIPYEHAKMMLADGARAFVGSVNFSTASTTNARELGIFFDDPGAIAMISRAFEQDWAHASTPPAASTVTCPAVSN